MGGQVLNLIGQLHGKFYQHLDARFVVHYLVGYFVPQAEVTIILNNKKDSVCDSQWSLR